MLFFELIQGLSVMYIAITTIPMYIVIVTEIDLNRLACTLPEEAIFEYTGKTKQDINKNYYNFLEVDIITIKMFKHFYLNY